MLDTCGSAKGLVYSVGLDAQFINELLTLAFCQRDTSGEGKEHAVDMHMVDLILP